MNDRFGRLGLERGARGRFTACQGKDGASKMVGDFAVGAHAFGTFAERAKFGGGYHATDSHFDLVMARYQAAFAEDLMRPADEHREHVASAAQREIADAALEFMHRAVD